MGGNQAAYTLLCGVQELPRQSRNSAYGDCRSELHWETCNTLPPPVIRSWTHLSQANRRFCPHLRGDTTWLDLVQIVEHLRRYCYTADARSIGIDLMHVPECRLMLLSQKPLQAGVRVCFPVFWWAVFPRTQ